MPVQEQDVAYIVDYLTALSEFSGSTAKSLAVSAEMMLKEEGPPQRGTAPDLEDVTRFTAICDGKIAEVRRELESLARRVRFSDAASVALLFGQPPLGTGHPYELQFELQFLSTLLKEQARPSRLRRIGHAQEAYSAVRLARRLRILEELRDRSVRKEMRTASTLAEIEAEEGYRGVLSASWASVIGYFVTEYDELYSKELRAQLLRYTPGLPNIDVLSYLQNGLHLSLGINLTRFAKEARYHEGLANALSTRTILSTVLSRTEFKVLAKHLDGCRVDLRAARDSMDRTTRRQVDTWLDLLCLETSDLGGRDTAEWTREEARLLNRPIFRCPDGRLILCLPQRLLSDLSQVLHHHWSEKYRDSYFDARGRALETVASAALSGRFPGAEILENCTYRLDSTHTGVEVDGLILWNDILVILESKSAYFTKDTKSGRDNSTSADLLRTVGDGFYQASRLIAHLQNKGSVTLSNSSASITLEAKRIRRAYITIPTCDFMGGAPVLTQMLWTNRVVPRNAVPLVVTVQDLALIADMLPDHLDLLAYLDFREEILAHPEIIMADELEILGSYIGGYDVVGDKEGKLLRAQKEGADPNLEDRFFVMANRQEKYVSPWLRDRRLADDQGLAAPEPPKRHHEQVRASLREMWASTDDATAFSLASHLDDDLLAALVADESVPRRGKPLFGVLDSLGFLRFSSNDTLKSVRRMPIARKMQSACRIVLYLQHGPSGRTMIAYAEKGGLHQFYDDVSATLTRRSRLGALTEWNTHFELHRKRRVDESAMAVLRQGGVAEDIARGVAARGLQTQLLDLLEQGIEINQAANTLFGPYSRIASSLDTEPAQMSLNAVQIADALRLLERGEIDSRAVEPLLHMAEKRPTSDVAEVARAAGLLNVVEPNSIRAAVDELLADQARQTGGPLRTGKRARTQLLGELKNRHPKISMQVATEYLTKRLDEQSQEQEVDRKHLARGE